MSLPDPDKRSPNALAKRQCRRSIIAAIAALDPPDRSAQEAALVEAFWRLPGWTEAETVLLYVSAFPEEIRTAPLLSIAYDAGKRVILPRVDRVGGRLRLHRVVDPRRELSPGVLGIREPDAGLPEVAANAVDWVLVPGVAFDDRGYRLGRGAGHYDRLLPAMRPDCVCWALGLNCQLVPCLPVEPHDVALDGVTTPGRTIRGVGRSGGVRGPSDRGEVTQSTRTSSPGTPE
jgi:5-formyltetrahydrofolate cyclo-ligase